MNVLCWNINHRIREKAIHPLIPELIKSNPLDVILFNEFVDGASRSDFKKFLADHGFKHQHTTPTAGRHNQIFLASKMEYRLLSSLKSPPIEPISSNQCVFVCGEKVFYSLRVPAYKKVTEKRLAWSYYLSEIVALKPNVIVGDFNIDPIAHDQWFFENLKNFGFQLQDIVGSSFLTNKGLPRTLDHLFTSGVDISNARFTTSMNGKALVGKTSAFASDHAPILFTIAVP